MLPIIAQHFNEARAHKVAVWTLNSRQFKDWSPYENGEVSNDSYWEDTWINQGQYKDFVKKFCYYTSGAATAPNGSGYC